jgi:HPt (histidine-containing phosphotransfer) domain-containing protein
VNGGGSGPDDDAEARLRAVVESIGGHARSANLARADRLSEALAEVAAGALDESDRRRATDIAHQLVGSAGTFGFPGASQLAGEIERYFVEADLADPVRLATARDQVRRVQEELATGSGYQPDDEPDPTS